MNLRLNSFQAYQEAYKKSVESPEVFWADLARKFRWKSDFSEVLSYNLREGRCRWFADGQLNICENALDVHAEINPNKTAFFWEANHPDEVGKKISYGGLLEQVCKLANGLKAQGIQKGDRVIIYMPMILESLVAMLACARIGAIHSVVFAGFSAKALRDRIIDAEAKMLICTDGMRRDEKEINVKATIDQAIEGCQSLNSVLIFKHCHNPIQFNEEKDMWWHELVQNQALFCEAEKMNAEDPLFILYTSGSTGKPKGVVHTHGGYMVYTAYSFQNVFQYQQDDVYWCTADIGWITGHSYIVYGPLLSGASSVIFEGIPTFPNPGRFWAICDKYKVNQFYTAPTAIRALMACGLSHVQDYSLNSLKVIGSVGEPINEEAWSWYHQHIGKSQCPIVDTWWQTETGGIMISGLGNHHPLKATYAGYPLPGIQPVLLNQEGVEKDGEAEGYLAIKYPWPSMIRTTWGNHQRCVDTYFAMYPGYYFTGDGAKRDAQGMYRIMGRVDDVINVSGHRFGTAELEDAINSSKSVVESAVIGFPHAIKGQGIYAFVIAEDQENLEAVKIELVQNLIQEIGPIAKPDKIQFVSGLPKTRSGKIMRRILRKIASNELDQLGDTSTLVDPKVLDELLAGRK